MAGLLAAVADEERFLAEHGSHERAGTVRFFLAVDHDWIARNAADPAKVKEHARRAPGSANSRPFAARTLSPACNQPGGWSQPVSLVGVNGGAFALGGINDALAARGVLARSGRPVCVVHAARALFGTGSCHAPGRITIGQRGQTLTG